MTTLVTGGTGFIGQAVVRALLARGEAVRVMVRATSSRDHLGEHLKSAPLTFVQGDLLEPGNLAHVMSGCRALYHVAADYRLWVADPQVLYRANVEGTRALMQAALDAGVERIVYTSSVAALGLPKDGTPGDEETPVGLSDIIGHYKRSKFLAEAEVKRLVAAAGLPAVIVNPSAPVGPGDLRPTPTGRMLIEAAAGRMPAYLDTGLNLVDVADVAKGHLLAFDHGVVGQCYILGGANFMLRDILALVAGHVGRRAPSLRLPRAPLYPLALAAETWARFVTKREPFLTMDGLRMSQKRMFYSHAKAARELGYQPGDPRGAVTAAVDWFAAKGYLG